MHRFFRFSPEKRQLVFNPNGTVYVHHENDAGAGFFQKAGFVIGARHRIDQVCLQEERDDACLGFMADKEQGQPDKHEQKTQGSRVSSAVLVCTEPRSEKNGTKAATGRMPLTNKNCFITSFKAAGQGSAGSRLTQQGSGKDAILFESTAVGASVWLVGLPRNAERFGAVRLPYFRSYPYRCTVWRLSGF
jgi:hypothetical protein